MGPERISNVKETKREMENWYEQRVNRYFVKKQCACALCKKPPDEKKGGKKMGFSGIWKLMSLVDQMNRCGVALNFSQKIPI